MVLGSNLFTSHQQRFPPKLLQDLGFVNKKPKCAIESKLPFQLFTWRFSQGLSWVVVCIQSSALAI